MKKTAKQIIEDAITYLHARAWVRNTYGREPEGEGGVYPNGSCCAVGALKLAAGTIPTLSPRTVGENLDTYSQALDCVADAAPPNIGGDSWTIVTLYNDLHATSKEDVIDLFRRAAESCEP